MLLLINDRNVITTNAATGEFIAEHHIDPNKGYQAPKTEPPANAASTVAK